MIWKFQPKTVPGFWTLLVVPASVANRLRSEAVKQALLARLAELKADLKTTRSQIQKVLDDDQAVTSWEEQYYTAWNYEICEH